MLNLYFYFCPVDLYIFLNTIHAYPCIYLTKRLGKIFPVLRSIDSLRILPSIDFLAGSLRS